MARRIVNQSVVYWIAGLVILLDQYTKYLVRANLALGEAWSPFDWLAPILNIVHIENSGAAFGMFQSGGLIFTVIAIVVSVVIIYYSVRLPEGQWALRIVLGLQLGGALGNLVDRLMFGPVTDFISLLGILHTPVFNLSDLSITLGVILLVLLMWGEARHANRNAAGTPPPAEPVDVGGASS
jgi:signal peptidase II